jgi:hypothetical protein
MFHPSYHSSIFLVIIDFFSTYEELLVFVEIDALL